MRYVTLLAALITSGVAQASPHAEGCLAKTWGYLRETGYEYGALNTRVDSRRPERAIEGASDTDHVESSLQCCQPQPSRLAWRQLRQTQVTIGKDISNEFVGMEGGLGNAFEKAGALGIEPLAFFF